MKTSQKNFEKPLYCLQYLLLFNFTRVQKKVLVTPDISDLRDLKKPSLFSYYPLFFSFLLLSRERSFRDIDLSYLFLLPTKLHL